MRRPSRPALLAGVLVAGLAVPAVATTTADHGDEVAAVRSTAVDGGFLGRDGATAAAFSFTANNGRPAVVTAGPSPKPAALGLAGLADLDALVTAVDQETGDALWTARHDTPLSNDLVRSLEVDHNNTIAYLTSEADGATTLVEVALRDGSVIAERPMPGRIEDTAISVAGSVLWQVGTDGGDLLVTGFETGPDTIAFEDRPVRGQARSADAENDFSTGTIDAWRTMVVTGQETVFGSGGDAWTGAYRTDRDGLLWQRRWASPDGRRDTGVTVDMAHVPGTRGVAFVAGQTFTADRGFDLWLTALDAQTGVPLWDGPDGMRFHDGEAGGDDVPVDVHYERATGIVYVSATTERGTPHGEDVLVLAYDATTGDEVGRAFVGGTISNGDDEPVGLTTSEDGSRVLVGVELHQLAAPRFRAGVFAFDVDLTPAGYGLLPGGGDVADELAGVGTSVDGTTVLVGGAADTGSTGLDHVVGAFALDGFVPVVEQVAQVATSIDAVVKGRGGNRRITATLTDADGAALAGRELVLTLEDGTEIGREVTDAAGTAVHDPGDESHLATSYVVTFAGDDTHEPSSTTATSPTPGRS